MSPALSSLKSNSKSDSDEVTIKTKINRKRRVIQPDEEIEKDNVIHILTESSSGKKLDCLKEFEAPCLKGKQDQEKGLEAALLTC